MPLVADLSGNAPFLGIEKSMGNEWSRTHLAQDENDTFPIIELTGVVSDLNLHVVGTMGSATFVMKGGEDKNNLRTLKTVDDADSAITVTNTVEFYRDAPRYVQVTQSGGSGTLVDVHLHKRSL